MFISPLLDKDTRSARVVASVDNAARVWRPGAFVSAEIPIDQTPANLAVPKSALQTLERDNVVFVRTDEGFEARKVSLGRQDGRVAEVTAGLKAGEQIATANTFVLKADLGKAAVEHQH
jgi:cobalt-zinc-cadmium efflux system membrane fusion protein